MNPTNDSVEQRLKRHAKQDEIAFDERLHQRVMRHVQTNTTMPSAAQDTEDRRPNRQAMWIGPMLALAALVAVVVGGMWWSVPQRQVGPPLVRALSIPMPDEILLDQATRLHEQARAKTEEPLAALQGDAVRFTQFLAGQLNVVPSQQ